MTWKPEPRLKINGVDYSGQTLRGARVTYGREEYLGQNRAPYASFSVEADTLPTDDIWPGQVVELDVKDTSGTYVRQFTGTITDYSAQFIGSGSNIRTRLNIQAVGRTGDMILAVTQATTPDPALGLGSPLRALDWQVMREILHDGLAPVIDKLVGTVNDLPGTVDDVRGAIGTINTATGPAESVWIEYPIAEARNAYEFAVEVANLSGGELWESRDGLINYASAPWQGLQFIDMPADVLQSAEITLDVGTSETYTRIFFDSPPSVSVPAGSKDTVGYSGNVWQFGSRELRYELGVYPVVGTYGPTPIINRITAALDRVQLKFSGLSVDLRIAAAEPYVDQLLNLNHRDRMTISDWPASIFGTPQDIDGRVHGWELELGHQTALLSIKLNDLNY